MTAAISVTLVNQLSEVERLRRLVEAFGEAEGLGPEAVFSMNLALDEVVTNIIRYAHDDNGQNHPIVVRLVLEQDVLTAHVEDDGRAFNPLEAPAPDLEREHRRAADRRTRHSPGAIGDDLGGIPARGRTERLDHQEKTVTGMIPAS